jgi:hypothetical protein
MPVVVEDSVMTNSRVLLAVLSQRTSAKGRPYLSGWLGKARVVAFAGEPDARGDPTWELYVAEPELRDGLQRSAANPPERKAAQRPATEFPGAGASPDASRLPFRRESEAARRARVARAITTACGGGEGDP